jgi:acyl carrier protein
MLFKLLALPVSLPAAGIKFCFQQVLNAAEAELMDPAPVKEALLNLQLRLEESEITEDASFQEDLDADSLDLVEAVLALEEEFGVNIPEEEMEDVKTVGEAINVVMAKLGASS